MKYCENCGDSIREKSRYCKSCGNFLRTVEKFSVEEERGKFCHHCGAAILKQYCPQCGGYASDVKIKSNGLNMGRFIGNVGNQNKPKRTTAASASIKNNQGSVKELFASVFAVKEDSKMNVINAGIFAIMLAFLLGVCVFIVNEGLVNSIIGILKEHSNGLDLLELKGIKKVTDLKMIIWSIFTGTAVKGTLTDGVNIDVGVSGILPFACLPILVLFIWLIEFIRKALMKTERTFQMAIMQSGIFAVFAAVLTYVFSYKYTYKPETTEVAWEMIQEILDRFMNYEIGERLVLSVGPSITSVFFTMFFITLLSLLILPGLKVENYIWKEIRKTVTVFLGIILCMTVVPGVITAIIFVSKTSGLNLVASLCWIVILSGMYATSIFTGNTQWCDVVLQDSSKGMMISAKNTWTKFVVAFADSQNMDNEYTYSSSIPFATLHICLILVGTIAVIYISMKVWKNISCDWTMAAVLSLVTGAGCATFLIMLQKLFHFGGEMNSSICTMQFYFGKDEIFSVFLKETIVIAILCMAGYMIWNFMEGKISTYLQVKNQWILLGTCICCLCFSVIVVSGIKLKSFRPVVESCTAVMCDYAEEKGENYYDNGYGSRAEMILDGTSIMMTELDEFLSELKDNTEIYKRIINW